MLKRLLVAVAVLALLAPAVARAGLTRQESALLDQMNRVRAQHGLRPLHYDARLERAARSHTHRMLAQDVFTHGAFGSRLASFGVTASVSGENLAWGLGSWATARGVVAAWLASPEHRANLLRPSFSRVGVGDLAGPFQGYRGAHVVTADFVG
ncbi:MAG: CAP domain-containing protein [Gaiellaceae bacterium]